MNKKSRSIVSLVVTGLLLCAGSAQAGWRDKRMVPKLKEGQQVVKGDANAGPAVLSTQKNAVFLAMETTRCADNPAATLVVANGTSEPWYISNRSIELHGHRPLTAAEYTKKVKRQAVWSTVLGMGAGLALDAVDRSNAERTGVYKGDAARLAILTPGMVQEASELQIDEYRETVFEAGTVDPGTHHGGRVIAGKDSFDLNYKRKKWNITTGLYVRVHVGGEDHDFAFDCVD